MTASTFLTSKRVWAGRNAVLVVLTFGAQLEKFARSKDLALMMLTVLEDRIDNGIIGLLMRAKVYCCRPPGYQAGNLCTSKYLECHRAL